MYRLEVAAKLPEDVARVGWKFFDHSQVDEPSHEVPIIVCVGGGGLDTCIIILADMNMNPTYMCVCIKGNNLSKMI